MIGVDDEPDLREMVAAYLGKYGFAVAAAADGRERMRSGSPLFPPPLPSRDLAIKTSRKNFVKRKTYGSSFPPAGPIVVFHHPRNRVFDAARN